MDSILYINRAENELKLAEIIDRISKNTKIQTDLFDIKDPETYYSAVITHSYYSIFYMAKAYLLTKGVKTEAPEEHKKTFDAFKSLAEKGAIDLELLKIYEKLIVRADTLLNIFKIEKVKRGKYTYATLPQANSEPASESISNAKTFFKHIYNICRT